MTLPQEMEALVEEVAQLLSGDHPTSWARRPNDKRQLRELVRGGIVAPDTITRDDYRDDARAIIPLIYTAGRRAGRVEAEQAALHVADQISVSMKLEELKGNELTTAICMIATARAIQDAIRSISEQEKSRGL